MKFQAGINTLICIIMLIISGYLMADASVMSLDLLSNPNLNVAVELIRLFWGVTGVIYFLYYLYQNGHQLFTKPISAENSRSKRSTRKAGRKRRPASKSK